MFTCIASFSISSKKKTLISICALTLLIFNAYVSYSYFTNFSNGSSALLIFLLYILPKSAKKKYNEAETSYLKMWNIFTF